MNLRNAHQVLLGAVLSVIQAPDGELSTTRIWIRHEVKEAALLSAGRLLCFFTFSSFSRFFPRAASTVQWPTHLLVYFSQLVPNSHDPT